MVYSKKKNITHCLNISLEGNTKTIFKCKDCDSILAEGYSRVVIGDRGPYIEFGSENIKKENIFYPEEQFHIYFDEYCSKCSHKIFIYHQRKTVSYADYKIDMWYICPTLLKVKNKIVLDNNKKTIKSVRLIF